MSEKQIKDAIKSLIDPELDDGTFERAREIIAAIRGELEEAERYMNNMDELASQS